MVGARGRSGGRRTGPAAVDEVRRPLSGVRIRHERTLAPSLTRAAWRCPGRGRSRRAPPTTGPRGWSPCRWRRSGVGRPDARSGPRRSPPLPRRAKPGVTGHGPGAAGDARSRPCVAAKLMRRSRPARSRRRGAPRSRRRRRDRTARSSRPARRGRASRRRRPGRGRSRGRWTGAAGDGGRRPVLEPNGAHHATIRAVRSPPIAPSTRWTIRCARACASCSSWVTSTIVWPRRLRSSQQRECDARRCGVSSAPVGSSARRTAGPLTMARAIATRCRSPPLSVLGKCLALSAEPELAEQLVGPAAGPRRRPCRRAAPPRRRCRRTLRSSSRWKNWKTKPDAGRAGTAPPRPR